MELKDRYSFKEIVEGQKKPLDFKIAAAVEVLKNAFTLPGPYSVAFSGGKDSTVLWHLIRTYFPDQSYHVIFGNTGVEFPESLKFARHLGKEWGDGEKVLFHEVLPLRLEEDELKYEAQRNILDRLIREGRLAEVLKNDGKLKSALALERMATSEEMEDFRARGLIWKKGIRKSYWYCVDQYGWPILGKSACKLTAKRINIDCFLRFSETVSDKEKLKDFYDLLRHVKVSNHCCSILKKEPSEKKQAELGVKVVIKGLMAAESHARMVSFSSRGHIFCSSRPHAQEFYHVSPLSFWTDDDIWEYIRLFNVPYGPLYDIEYTNHKGQVCKIKRNGCVSCATDIAFPNNHFSVLRQTHPEFWELYMSHGMAEQLIALQRYMGNGKKNYINIGRDADDVMERRPCAFDDIGEYIEKNEFTDSEYDSEAPI